jgi:alpha-L-rhamnosidase
MESRMARRLAAVAFTMTLAGSAFSLQLAPEPVLPAVRPWTARWLFVPDASLTAYGVYHFRRRFSLGAVPSTFRVHVSADNRYLLYANGSSVASGPARGDLFHWRYETVDLAPFLRTGENVLAAVVWNLGPETPEAQTTNVTGFLLQGDGPAEKDVNTGPGWKCIRDEAYEMLPIDREEIRHQYYVAGPGDKVTAARYPWGWETAGFDDAAWKAPIAGPTGSSRDAFDAPSRWMLVPRSIPAMDEHPERLERVRRASGVTAPAAFPRAPAPFTVPPRTRARLLLDQGYLTTAYPELVVSGGKDAAVGMKYAENLWVPGTGDKGHRDEIEGKEMRGLRDLFIADGGARRVFRPLWWRTYRYLELNVDTAEQPLTIEDLRGIFTAYPFTRKARFDAGDPELDRILDVGWRTARLCAHETYMDCPYYEQLQYVGDTRIQALVSYYASGDDRLARNAIEQIDDSRTSEGLTMSRFPTRLQQYIPPFSLWWIGMVHDYWRYRDDPAFVRARLPGVRTVLSFFSARQRASGSLGPLPWWNFLDWTSAWPSGSPPGWNFVRDWNSPTSGRTDPRDPSGASAPIDLQLLLAYDEAADLEDELGSKTLAAAYRQEASRLRAEIPRQYWDAGRQLYADTPAKKNFSQHANVLAILGGVVEGEAARALMGRLLSETDLVPCSIYFRHYVHAALNRTGEGDRLLDQLGPWRRMLALGLTTWAEQEDPSRSECHAWGSSPNFELLRTVLGVDSAAPGFRRVRIRPFLGRLTRVSGSVPHPRGEVVVSLRRDGDALEADIRLPEGVDGEVLWRGARSAVGPGQSKLRLTRP